MAERLDGKFEVVRELERSDALRSVEAIDATGRKVRVNWFNVSDPKSRSGFHRYRTAVKNAGSPLLLDAVARPGAYYTVWEPLDGIDAQTWLEGHPKDEGFRRALKELGDVLESYGFALQDAHVLALQNEKEVRPALAALRSADRSSDEIKALNAVLLEPGKPQRAAWLGGKRNPPPARVTSAPVKSAPPLGRDGNSVGQNNAVQNGMASTSKKSVSRVPVRRRLTIWGIIPGMIFLALFGWLGAQAVATFLEPPTVEVPNVKGKSLQDAAKILSDARLTPRVTEGSDQSQVKGIILSQIPAAGATITEQRVVEITVNRPRPLLMPDLAGKTVGEAKLALKEASLVIGRVAVIPAPEGVARDTVLGQSPPAQTEVVRGQGITVLVSGSKAPEGQTMIPDLSGLSFDDAKLIISAAGLRLVDVRTKPSNLPSGTVLSQSPVGYKMVPLDGDATVTVAVASSARRPVIPKPVQPTPPPPPPAPVTVDPPAPPPVTDPNAGTQSVGANNLPPITQPENVTPPATQPPAPPAPPLDGPENQNPLGTAAKAKCPVTFLYIVQADLGTANIEIRVRDDDGERVGFSGPVPGGQPVELKDYLIRGKATFTVFVDGVSQAPEERDPKC
jgi:beta-lactam-binding protein with PASTA domain